MQTQNPLFDDMAKAMMGAASAFQAVGEEARTAFKAQAQRFVSEMDLVPRAEHDALKAELTALLTRVASLEAALNALQTAKTGDE